ncbi:glycoside hydrolase 5 family protein [Flammeovirga aprica]|uniref:mannan endo-1,4-beta-mannosidase n=1 Tax=Flammeovirga aprica JL-4 TaxID=694437 RepID=A0A7X9XCD1_9BACT|nr:glycoside hydrolase family 2 TIM barrel-domain containing protein [Flammeovirga aprica]NME71682.1 mannanase [Flammeovirga aprica JL-4]
MKKILTLLLSFFAMQIHAQDDFVKVKNGQFVINQKAYHYIGTNFWYGMNLGVFDQPRLIRELDRLEKIGVKNLRVMALSEGDKNTPWCMQPTVQSAPGEFNEELLKGLDFLLVEMQKREMKAVVCLNNFWPWSGGFSQYIKWTKGGSIPFPPPAENGDWHTYGKYASHFYENTEAQQLFQNAIKKVVNRTNSITQKAYKNDPTIMSWQLANEPENILKGTQLVTWINTTAKFIKSLDQNHMVTTGSEGYTPSSNSGTDFEKDHLSEDIDYMTFHIWVQNWGWFDPHNVEGTYDNAVAKAKQYIQQHIAIGNQLNKPIVLEEFGISRDKDDHSDISTVDVRNQYYATIFNELVTAVQKGDNTFVGCNFWAWGGEGRPSAPHSIWKTGDDLIGDPPHEYQGWYSVYQTDKATLKIIKSFNKKLKKVAL